MRKRRPLLTANHSSLFRRASAPVKYRWSLKRQKWFLGEELQATEWSLRHQQNLGLVALIEIVSYILIESIWHVRKQLNSRASWYKFVYEVTQHWKWTTGRLSDAIFKESTRLFAVLNATRGSSYDTLGTNIVSFGKAVLQESSLCSLARSTELGWVDEKGMPATADTFAILEQIFGTPNRPTMKWLHRKIRYYCKGLPLGNCDCSRLSWGAKGSERMQEHS